MANPDAIGDPDAVLCLPSGPLLRPGVHANGEPALRRYFGTGDLPVTEYAHYGLGLQYYTHFTYGHRARRPLFSGRAAWRERAALLTPPPPLRI